MSTLVGCRRKFSSFSTSSEGATPLRIDHRAANRAHTETSLNFESIPNRKRRAFTSSEGTLLPASHANRSFLNAAATFLPSRTRIQWRIHYRRDAPLCMRCRCGCSFDRDFEQDFIAGWNCAFIRQPICEGPKSHHGNRRTELKL